MRQSLDLMREDDDEVLGADLLDFLYNKPSKEATARLKKQVAEQLELEGLSDRIVEQGPIEVLIQFKRLGNHSLPLPAYQTAEAAGFDFRSNDEMTLNPGDIWMCPTGFACSIQKGFEGQVRPRSGLATKHGITVVNAPGTVDSDYRGELLVALINISKIPFKIEHGMRVAQMVISPVAHAHIVEVDQLDTTDRGTGGFGSTGLK